MEKEAVISGLFCMSALRGGLGQLCARSLFFLLAQINLVPRAEKTPKDACRGGPDDDAAAAAPNDCCSSCKRAPVCPAGRQRDVDGAPRGPGGAPARPSAADLLLVVERLGMRLEEDEEEGEWGRGRCGGCSLVEAAEGVLESKTASTEEVVEAFSVFDRDGDGYITAAELQDVMRRLGMEEGRDVGDCSRMIDAYDEDGDGRINVAEFKRLLESAK